MDEGCFIFDCNISRGNKYGIQLGWVCGDPVRQPVCQYSSRLVFTGCVVQITYLQQMRALQTATLAAVAASATPAPSSVCADRQAVAHLIRNNQVHLAFETALNQGDQAALEFVCNNVDPDELFRHPGALSQPVLISLLQQLSLRLDSDTDLKFRYMEHIVDVLQPHDDDIGMMVPKVVEGLMQSLTEFYNTTANPSLKRQARVLNQLVRNLRKI
ncbi:unnamed protein product [Angiostrongylus costaricensis]|uniref:CTLH domain-containing protein n=1 Tax=Angiostrongylus costaricensis TaxID=334426 RepID=A0A0R3PVB3_ANGCS|nr:unnamed protein product [Angiostrongylus costaricensis]